MRYSVAMLLACIVLCGCASAGKYVHTRGDHEILTNAVPEIGDAMHHQVFLLQHPELAGPHPGDVVSRNLPYSAWSGGAYDEHGIVLDEGSTHFEDVAGVKYTLNSRTAKGSPTTLAIEATDPAAATALRDSIVAYTRTLLKHRR